MSGGVKIVIAKLLKLLAMRKGIIGLERIVKICATEEFYDLKGRLVGFKQPYLTLTEKPKILTHEKYKEIRKGMNAIVVGDYLVDAYVGESLDRKSVV